MARPASSLGRPAVGLPRYYMDCAWWLTPKWAGVVPDVLFVHSAAVSYCTQHGTDGRMPADIEDLSLALGVKLSVVRRALPTLLADDRRRWARAGADLEIVGFVDHNPVAAEVAEHAERQRSRGALGNHRRWHEARGVTDPECSYCDSTGDHRQATSQEGSHPPSPQATVSPGESHGMGWDGMGTDDSQPPDNSRPPATSPAGRPGSDLPPPAQTTNDLLTAAAERLAEAETARRTDRGELDNPGGYRRSRIAPIRREHEDFWRQLVAQDPTLTAQQLADAVTEPGPQPATNGARSHPLDEAQIAARKRQEAGTAHLRAIAAEPPDPDAATKAAALRDRLRHPHRPEPT